MSRPLWLVSLIKRSFSRRFLLARATKAPAIGAALDRLLFDGDDLFYLPPDRLVRAGARRTVPVGQAVEAAADVVLPSQVVEHFIEQAGERWVMNACICRDASGCRDYPIDLGCLFLGEAAAGINPALGRRVTQEEALEHVRRCRDAGLVHLVGRNKLDTVWLGVKPGDRLLTICNCCPCCCLWRVLPHISSNIGERVTRMDGVAVAVTDRCAGCGTCTAPGVCFADAIVMEGDRASIGDACRGCGRCVEVCPQGAIELTIEGSAFVEDSIARIAPRVDVS
jgi:Pyruvate/2-oxoacid:ferredoxin oxidoreductase delta subunit